MALTAFGQKKLGDIALGIADWTMPSTFLGIFTSSPGENGSLTSEFTGGSYARQALTAAMSAANATTGISTNTSAITYPAPTAALGMTLYAGIIDSVTLGAGNVIWYAPWFNPKVINNGDPAVVVDIGEISVGIAGAVNIMLSSYLMKKLTDHGLGKASYSKPTLFHGLLASNPTIAGTLSSEVGVGGYARQGSAMSAVDATTGLSSNATAITYPDPTADYPDVNYEFGADAVSGGNLLFATQLPSTLSIRNGRAPALFDAGSINFTIA